MSADSKDSTKNGAATARPPESSGGTVRNPLRAAGAHLVRSALYPFFEKRWHPSAAAYLREMYKYEFASFDAVRQEQWSRLKTLLALANDHSPYYRGLFRHQGIRLDDIRSFEDLRFIPSLSKATVQQKASEIVCDNRKPEEGKANASGGSTGKPVQFFQDMEYWDRATAADWFVQSWWGIKPGDRTASVWGADRDIQDQTWRDKVYSFLVQTRVCNAFAISTPRMEEFAAMLDGWQPRHITGYSSALEVFAQFVLQRPHLKIRPLAIRATAEVLTPEARDTVERAFQSRVYNFYGSREINNLAAECPSGGGLHVNALGRYIEIVDEAGKPLPVGVPGRVLVTDLTNSYMPFIRYEIEDVSSWTEGPCRCGRPFPLLSRIWGRSSDFIATPDGRMIHGEYFTHLFYDVPGVAFFQLKQTALREVSVSIVARPGADAARSITLLRERMAKALGADVNLAIQIVDHIDRTASGKHRFVVSTVKAPWSKGANTGGAAPSAGAARSEEKLTVPESAREQK
jgi:phenylacetate-CoA ligase